VPQDFVPPEGRTPRYLYSVAPLATRERPIFTSTSEDCEDTDSDTGIDDANDLHVLTWSYALASEVFGAAGDRSAAMSAAHKARLLASRCCQECVGWTTVVEASARDALDEEIRLRVGNPSPRAHQPSRDRSR